MTTVIAGCRPGKSPGGERLIAAEGERTEGLDDVARAYVRLALALGERDPDSIDFSIAPEAVSAEMHRRYLSLDEIDREAARLQARLQSLTTAGEDTQRAEFLRLQLRAMATRTAMLRGRFLPFDAEASALFHTTRLADTHAAERARLRARVALLLAQEPGRGKRTGSVDERYATYDRQFLVPSRHLEEVLRAALGACREHTLPFLQLPKGESVELTFVRNKPWSAFSRYHGHGHSSIAVNLDLPITVDQALDLACHEGYPGHHVFNTLREADLVGRRHLPEAEVQLTFSPQSYVSESAAAYAPRLALSDEERVAIERDLLFPAAGLPAGAARRYVLISNLVRGLDSAEPALAQEYLDGRLEFVRAEDELAREMLMLHSEASLLYLNEYRSYMLAYTDGPRRMQAYLSGTGQGGSRPEAPSHEGDRLQQWRRFQGLTRQIQPTLPSTEKSSMP